jgi:release factor glutamine methyltransferase
MTNPATTSWTIESVLKWSKQYLDKNGAASPRLDAELFIGKALQLERIQLYAQYDRPMSPEELKIVRASLERRVTGEPTAYILGTKEFMGHRFQVTPAVLIPRPDTEVLIEAIIGRWDLEAELKILDVGVGTGCIGISLAARMTRSQVEGWDVSLEAVEVARHNAATLGIENIQFKQCDMLTDENWPEAAFDLIASNPPYIESKVIPDLAVDVKDFEPQLALDGGEDGLHFYRQIVKQSARSLKADGALVLEIGFDQANSIRPILETNGFSEIEIVKDYGDHDRVVIAKVGSAG